MLECLEKDLAKIMASPAAEDALWQPQKGEARPIRVFFDAPAQEVNAPGAKFPVDSTSFEVFLQAADAERVKRGDLLTVRGELFKVSRIKPDGQGGLSLTLYKAVKP